MRNKREIKHFMNSLTIYTCPYSMTFCVFCICFYLNIVRVVFFSFFGGIESEKTVNYNISEAGFSSPPLQPPPFV